MDILAIPNLLPNPSEWITMAEEKNLWQPAKVLGPDQNLLQTQHRNNDIWFLPNGITQEQYADLNTAFHRGLDIYRKHVGLDKQNGILVHEGLQLNRYRPGSFYKEHIDGWTASHRQVSAVLYLNDVKEGGETYFPRQKISVKPRAGGIVFFPSNYCYLHEARAPISETKYCIVTWFHILEKKNA